MCQESRKEIKRSLWITSDNYSGIRLRWKLKSSCSVWMAGKDIGGVSKKRKRAKDNKSQSTTLLLYWLIDWYVWVCCDWLDLAATTTTQRTTACVVMCVIKKYNKIECMDSHRQPPHPSAPPFIHIWIAHRRRHHHTSTSNNKEDRQARRSRAILPTYTSTTECIVFDDLFVTHSTKWARIQDPFPRWSCQKNAWVHRGNGSCIGYSWIIVNEQ